MPQKLKKVVTTKTITAFLFGVLASIISFLLLEEVRSSNLIAQEKEYKASTTQQTFEVYTDERNKFSFQYPSELSLETSEAPNRIELSWKTAPILVFALSSPKEEEAALSEALRILRLTPQIQLDLLKANSTGNDENIKGEVRVPTLTSFATHPVTTQFNAFGLKIDSQENNYFMRLQNGQVLKITEFNPLSYDWPGTPEDIEAIIDSINPYL